MTVRLATSLISARPGEEEPRHGDPGRRDLRRRCATPPDGLGPGARPRRGRGRDGRPADHALLEPVPALPLPELGVREHRHRRGAEVPVRQPGPAEPRRSTPTQTGAKIVDGKMYVNNGFWDTYRTDVARLLACSTPNKAAEIVDGFVQQYRDGGWVARWSSPGYADLMTGTSSDVAFADAYTKGVQLQDAAGDLRGGRPQRDGHPADPDRRRPQGARQSIFLGYTHRTPARASRGRSRATSTTSASRRWRRSSPRSRPRRGDAAPS